MRTTARQDRAPPVGARRPPRARSAGGGLAGLMLLLGGVPLPARAAEPLTPRDVVHSALTRHPELRAAHERVAASRGGLTLVRGAFDEHIGAAVTYARATDPILPDQRAAFGADSVTQDNLTARVEANKTLRWGTQITPSVSLVRRSRALEPALGAADVLNRGAAELEIMQPLLRGLGDSSAVVQERAAEQELRAAELDAQAVAQRLVRDVVNAYWAYAAALDRLEILARSEALAARTAASTRALISADERPATEALQLEATEADRQRQRVQAEALVFSTRRQLGLAMGLGDAEALALPAPARGLPGRAPAAAGEALPEATVEAALERRPDVRAAQRRLAAARTVAEAADWNTLPRLDLSFGIGYAGQLDGSGPDDLVGALGDNLGLTVGTGLSLALPVRNAAQTGAQLRLLALRRQSEVLLIDLQRVVRANLAIRHNQRLRAADALRAADRALALFERALAAETDKVAAELGTVLDLVLSQERLLGAQIARVEARLRSASAAIDFSFEAGTLPRHAEDADALRRLLRSLEEGTP